MRPEPEAFAAPWEAEAFALAVTLSGQGHFTWAEWSAALGREIAAAPERPYYESWLAALETLAEARGLLTPAERRERIAAWDRAARATPHGMPVELPVRRG